MENRGRRGQAMKTFGKPIMKYCLSNKIKKSQVLTIFTIYFNLSEVENFVLKFI